MTAEDNSTQIFIGKLPGKVTDNDLEYEFRKFGKIKNVLLKKGYAFIEYETLDDSKEAVRAMDGHNFEGSKIVVEHASMLI